MLVLSLGKGINTLWPGWHAATLIGQGWLYALLSFFLSFFLFISFLEKEIIIIF
jgi:hypothetical protein